MSAVHPSLAKVEALRARWRGQAERLRRIAASLRAGEDWTVHLAGLPFVEEVPPVAGEAFGRDLRGADLRRALKPALDVAPASEAEAPVVAAISLEGLRNSTPLPDVALFPLHVEGAGEIALAMRRGERFLVGRIGTEPVGVVRWAARREHDVFTGGRPYVEVSGLSVLPRWRRCGYGGRLVAAAEHHARAAGFGHALLRTTEELGLVPWYTRQGYVVRRVCRIPKPDAPACLDVLLSKALAPNASGPGRLSPPGQPPVSRP